MPKVLNKPAAIRFPLPEMGLNTVTARSEPVPRASVDMRNVRVKGSDERMRISGRPGTKRLYGTSTLDTTASKQVLCCHHARFLDSGSNDANFIIHACSGEIWKACMGTGSVVTTITKIGTMTAAHRAQRVYAATYGGFTYLIDGYNAKKLKLDTEPGSGADLTAWTATAGLGTVPVDYRLMIVARGRIYMGCQIDHPNNWTCSRQGDPLDWDTTADDVGAPVVGNTGFRGGQIGQPIKALIAGKDDTIIFGCRNSIYELVGEPTLGSLLVRSTGIGILTSDSWCMGPSGEIYFVSPGGFYRLPLAGAPEPLSVDQVGSYFADIPETGYWVVCLWDAQRFGVHIYLTPDTPGPASHLFYNVTLNAFEPFDLPDDHGPITGCVYDGGTFGSRLIVLGGRQGIVMYNSEAVAHDESSSATNGANVAIAKQFFMGPINPAGLVDKAKMIELLVNLGEAPSGFTAGDMNVSVTVQTGKDNYGAYASSDEAYAYEFAGLAGRQTGIHTRIRGNSFFVKFSDSNIDKVFVVDQVVGRFLPAGRNR